jgi:hypothetical protein
MGKLLFTYSKIIGYCCGMGVIQMKRILSDLYGVSRSRHNRKPLKEWLEDEIRATERELMVTRNRPAGEKPHGRYLIEKAETKLERLRKELMKHEKS